MIVPARGGAEIALKIYIICFSSIKFVCAVRQRSPCVRVLCEIDILFYMLHLKLHITLYTWQFSYFTLRTSYSTLYIAHFTSHCTLKTPHFTFHTLHSTLHTLHCTLRTPNFIFHSPHFSLLTTSFILQTRSLHPAGLLGKLPPKDLFSYFLPSPARPNRPAPINRLRLSAAPK